MLRFNQNLNLISKRRTLRALFAHTQGYPYPVQIDSGFTRTSGAQLGLGSPAGQAAIFPGAVMKKQSGEVVTLSTDNSASADHNTRFGLAAQYVGGTLDELGSGSDTAVWRGRGSTYEVLAPVFATTVSSLSSAGTAYLTWNTSGQLSDVDNASGAATATNAVARLVDNLSNSANAVIIELLTP